MKNEEKRKEVEYSKKIYVSSFCGCGALDHPLWNYERFISLRLT
ncbi:MAG: hypothetical protein ACTSPI_11750 [Candidatus Heimdallarchaeaceae archaeon]